MIQIMDGKLFLDDAEYPCFSPEPPETVDGIAMSRAASSVYLALKEMGKTVIGISAECPEENCSTEMVSITRTLIQSARQIITKS